MQQGRAGWAHVRPQDLMARVLAGALVVVRPHDAALCRRRSGVAAFHALFAGPAVARLWSAHKQLHVRRVQQAPADARSRLAVPFKRSAPKGLPC